ncbi:hypothetical protein GJ744_011594 [Endocarpon pusillum]|uniref:Uncharacterized protein n=1 Tax=Endocarpon pusillum TaxID=364733 RepID=A0A8H7AGF2_9EURO|nr:hypothetical protein GJ744_011594 [Endocarpon pusillum]
MRFRHDLINDKYLVVKIPGTIHEFIARKVNHLIETQLVTIKETSNECTKRLIQDIEQLASRRIQLYGANDHREPDGQFLGKIRPGSMIFQLQDFGSNLATKYPNAELTKTITLCYHDLADYLTRAQEFDVQRPPSSNLRQLKEPPQPTEELTLEDEKKFRHLENKSSARSEASDTNN